MTIARPSEEARRGRGQHLARTTRLPSWLLATLWLLCQQAALAQAPAPPEAQARAQALEAMLADPQNQERTFEFARAAVAAGDVRGAISAFERMLRINPGLANIELELGVLYLNAGSPAWASYHLRRALNATDIPEPVRERAQTLLARAERSKSQHLFTGSLFAGVRYDSNANAGPESRLVRVNSTDGLLGEEATGRSDRSAELAGSINYTYALDSQAGHEIEASLSTYNRHYDENKQLDLNSISLDVGPRFYLGGGSDSLLSVRPYLLGSYLLLDGDRYLSYVGGGLNLRRFLGASSFVDASLEASDQKYHDSPTRTNNSARSGTLVELRTSLSHQLSAAVRLFGGLSAASRRSREDYEAFKEGGLRVGATVAYAAPFGLTASAWSTTFSLGARRTQYDAADPAIDAAVRRKDTRTDATLTTSVPVSPNLGEKKQ